jgi:hypothetical protein
MALQNRFRLEQKNITTEDRRTCVAVAGSLVNGGARDLHGIAQLGDNADNQGLRIWFCFNSSSSFWAISMAFLIAFCRSGCFTLDKTLFIASM